jgi:transglutaminase-like putative cysteine protease
MGRTLAACAIPALVISASWLRMQEPREMGEALVVVGLALLPALLPGRWPRGLAVVGASVGVLWIAFGAKFWELLPFRDERVVNPVVDDVSRGLGDYYGVVLPFDPTRHPEMHALLLVAIFAFVAATALLVAARRPLIAAAVTVGAVGWPATLVSDGGVAIGALALAAAFSILLFLRARSVPGLAVGAVTAALVVAVAVWASTATTFAREAALEWQNWDFRGVPARALGVRFVWEANYDGVRFPPTKTVVLEIEGPERAQYWRASTLDVFTADRWFEQLSPRVVADGERAVPLDAFAPPRARDESHWLEQSVEVKALVDDHLVAAGTPVSLAARSLGTVFFLSGGVLRARHTLDAGSRYRVWSYVPDPSPAALARAKPRYPAAAHGFLTVWGMRLPAFGEVRRVERVRTLLADPQYSAFGTYRPLYEEALRVTRGSRTPYAAVLALESWFRRFGGFRYDQQPRSSLTVAPLIDFVTDTKAGYCQHFAGAMAVMLRLLGIPSRVAVGFTSGRLVDGVWRVTDHNAHAWVEVWFPGHGWVAFDPTPGRGTFSGIYSFASENAQAVEALGRGQLDAAGRAGRGSRTSGDVTVARGSNAGVRPSLVVVALLLAALGAGVVGVSKWVVRRLRYLTSDPRRIASASRREMEAFLRDQRIEVSPSATLEDLRTIVEGELGLDGGSFTTSAARARFGRPGTARRHAEAARRELRELLGRARTELSLWARFRGFVSLRSLRGGSV